MEQFLSQRGRKFVKDMPPLMAAHFRIVDQLYHPKIRPEGYINMGTAETHLMDHTMSKLIQKIQIEMPVDHSFLHYDLSYGTLELRSAISDYWKKYVLSIDDDVSIAPENIIVTAGCSVALEFLATMLGDPDDVFLIPTPFYSGFVDDIQGRVALVPVGVDAGEHLSIEEFEKVLRQQQLDGKTVRGVLFSSPNNPAGTVYTATEIKGLISFCMQNDIDLISDELYAQTIHDPDAKFISAHVLTPPDFLHRVHVTGSFSKDFALSGFRTGFIISFNMDMIKGMQGLSYYANVSNHTQAILARLLCHEDLQPILNAGKKELRRNYNEMTASLLELGIITPPAQGGIFLFSDFGKFMPTKGIDGELALWDTLSTT